MTERRVSDPLLAHAARGPSTAAQGELEHYDDCACHAAGREGFVPGNEELGDLLEDLHCERGVEFADSEMRDRVLDALAQVDPDRIAHWGSDTMADTAGSAMPLQERVGAWHRERFPWAEIHHVTLKLAEEAGEVASAVIAQVGVNSATGSGSIPQEAADVVICLMAILDRWVPDADLLDEVEKKLAILSDRNSGHRSALQDKAGSGGAS